MSDMQCPYEDNAYMTESSSNKLIIDLFKMSDKKFTQWVDEFRKEVVYAWDELGVPIAGGQPIDNITSSFQSLLTYDVSGFSQIDENTHEKDCVVNNSTIGSACNQFFPTMLKTKNIVSGGSGSLSIYDFFANDGLSLKLSTTILRMIDSDVFGYFSEQLSEIEFSDVSWFEKHNSADEKLFWVFAIKTKKDGPAYLSKDEVSALKKSGRLKDYMIRGEGEFYGIRTYDPTARIMDASNMFRVCFGGTPASNFPPLTAKYLYLKFTEEIKNQEPIVVYDPSSGWGGRILGAMACCQQRSIHYVGTDPNTDHLMPELGITKYEYLADYFNGNIVTPNKNTFELFRVGSEVIHDEPEFQKYKGKVDFIFTSPPYFGAEGYSDDETQSSIKFPSYEEWREGFLRKTLETCVEWLKEGRWLCYNIADIRIKGSVATLQQDVIDILCGGKMNHIGYMVYTGNLKMVLKQAPSGSKETTNKVPTTRNFCQVSGKTQKYEPILMFKKLKSDDASVEEAYGHLKGYNGPKTLT